MIIAKLTPGDGTLTRRVKRRCKEIGFDVNEEREWNGYGYEIIAYHVPADILAEEECRRHAELEKKEEAARRKADAATKEREYKQAEARETRIQTWLQEFPKLTRLQLEQVTLLKRPDETGYQLGYGTKSYWGKLGYRISGDPSGYVVRGTRLVPLFSSRALTEKRPQNPETLWTEWCEKKGPAIALADAVRFANRLQKVRRNPSFYALKDEWIRRNQVNLTEGRISRIETRECWGCGGDGVGWYGGFCNRCGGEGIYSQRTLYEHVFSIEQKSYTFHSYVRPETVTENPGSDEKVYGRPFVASELPLPPQSTLVAMVATALRRLSDARSSKSKSATSKSASVAARTWATSRNSLSPSRR